MIAQLGPYISQERIEKLKREIYRINETLPLAMAVKNFYFTQDELAPASAIKVSRTQLIKKLENGEIELTAFNRYAAPQAADDCESPLLQEVRRIIAQVLELDEAEVTPEAHIFHDLGATSIQYFSILTALAQHFSVSDYESSDTYCYTSKEICAYIERKL